MEVISWLSRYIEFDIFIGFVWYSVGYLVLRYVHKNKQAIDQFDQSAGRLMSYLGLLFALLYFGDIVFSLFLIETDKFVFIHRAVGDYWPWLIAWPLVVILLTHLLKYPKWRKSLLYRLLLIPIFLISYELFVITFTSWQRGSVRNLWPVGLDLLEVVLSITLKLAVFLFLVFVFQKIDNSKRAISEEKLHDR